MYTAYPVMNMIVISCLCFTFNKLALCVEKETFCQSETRENRKFSAPFSQPGEVDFPFHDHLFSGQRPRHVIFYLIIPNLRQG